MKWFKYISPFFIVVVILLLLPYVQVFEVIGQSSVIRGAYLVEIVPPWDTIDNGVADCVINALSAAEETNRALILKIDTYGGYLDAAMRIGDAIYASKVPVLVFVENKALSAGTMISLPSDILALKKGSIVGAMQPVQIDPATGSIQVINESKVINPILEKAISYSRRAGRNETAVRRFVTESLTLSDYDAVEYHVADYVVADLDDMVEKVRGRTISVGNTQFVIDIGRGEIEYYTCSIRSRAISLLSNAYLSTILITIGLLATVFALVSGKIAVLPLSIGILLLGLISSGVNPNMVAIFFILLGTLLLALELFVIPGFGIVGISGIVLLALGFSLLPVYIPAGYAPNPDAINAIRIFVGTVSIVLGVFFGLMLFKVVEAKRRKAVEFTPKGKVGRAIDDIYPGSIGFVVVEGEYWRATSREYIEKNTEVIVEEIDERGVLVVRKKT